MAKPRKGRKPTKLTPELTERLCNLLRTGVYVETACKIVGLHRSTLHDWCKLAQDGSEPFASFADAVEKAIAESEARDLAIIARASATDAKLWVASAWRLERRFPERWGRRERHEVTGADGGPLEVKAGVVMLPPEDDRKE